MNDLTEALGTGPVVLDGNASGFDLKGKFNGTDRDNLVVSAVTDNGSNFTGDENVWLIGSTLTADGSRITVSAKLTVDDSKVVIKNSGAGGLDVNYYPGEATFTDSTLETTNMYNVLSYRAGQSRGPCSITFQGNSVVNTDARNGITDNGGANRATGSKYVVTGGSYLVAYNPDSNADVTTPTNGATNGDEMLFLFTLPDSSVNELHPINKDGQAYNYTVANASSDNKKHVWTPAAKVSKGTVIPATGETDYALAAGIAAICSLVALGLAARFRMKRS